jgi:hypothetical protein
VFGCDRRTGPGDWRSTLPRSTNAESGQDGLPITPQIRSLGRTSAAVFGLQCRGPDRFSRILTTQLGPTAGPSYVEEFWYVRRVQPVAN